MRRLIRREKTRKVFSCKCVFQIMEGTYPILVVPLFISAKKFRPFLGSLRKHKVGSQGDCSLCVNEQCKGYQSLYHITIAVKWLNIAKIEITGTILYIRKRLHLLSKYGSTTRFYIKSKDPAVPGSLPKEILLLHRLSDDGAWFKPSNQKCVDCS